MKGYLFGLDNQTDIERIIRKGLFGTRQKDAESWQTRNVFLGTLADYLTIAPGDRIFFFQNRMIYGIGRVLVLNRSGNMPVLLNYPNSLDFVSTGPIKSKKALLDPSEDDRGRRIRVVVPFIPSPFFFSRGIDMDEVLSSAGADVAWGLRFWSDRSFQQLGVAETQLLTETFFRRFYGSKVSYYTGQDESSLLKEIHVNYHGVASIIAQIKKHPGDYLTPDGRIERESGLHALLIEHMHKNKLSSSEVLCPSDRVDIFHELPASPPKPPEYSDRIDIVGTREVSYAPNYPIHFDIVEAKRDSLDVTDEDEAESLLEECLPQVMRYVDFMAFNYTGGDYGAIDAIYVARSFSPIIKKLYQNAKKGKNKITSVISRSYVLSPREKPATRVWRKLRLMEYSWDKKKALLRLKSV